MKYWLVVLSVLLPISAFADGHYVRDMDGCVAGLRESSGYNGSVCIILALGKCFGMEDKESADECSSAISRTLQRRSESVIERMKTGPTQLKSWAKFLATEHSQRNIYCSNGSTVRWIECKALLEFDYFTALTAIETYVNDVISE